MRAQTELRTIPLSGLSGFRINCEGIVYRTGGARAASRTRVTPLTRTVVEESWRRHADPVGKLVFDESDSGKTTTYTLASFCPEPGADSTRRRFVLGDGKIVSNRMPGMTEQRPLPLRAGDNPEDGWYLLTGVALVPAETTAGFEVRETRGTWCFHGPSMANRVFRELKR